MTRNSVIVNDREFEIYLSEKVLQVRIHELGIQINEAYKGRTPIIISVLNGAFMFTADLVRSLDFQLKIEFVRLSSYSGTQSTGEVKNTLRLNSDVENQDVIIVEDIIDTGLTMSKFIKDLKSKSPRSISVVTLLRKPSAIIHEVQIDYVGFDIPNDFVIGYGLDYDEIGRELPQIYKLHE